MTAQLKIVLDRLMPQREALRNHPMKSAMLVTCGSNTDWNMDAIMAHLQIKPDQLEAFTAAVKEEMEAALRLEPGVVAIYAVAEKGDPTKWTFFEMYVDEEAYQIHRDTPHFQKYFHTTKDMIADRVLLEAVPVELRDKHNTPADK